MLVTTTDRFLLSFLGNYKSTEQGFLLEVLPTIFTASSLQSTAVWFCRCSMTLLKFFLIKNEKCTHVLWIKGLFGKLHARTKHKTSHSHSNSVSTTITLGLDINLLTWLEELFSDFAKELNKKARANTKSKRNIFTLSALRYEMADESVSIKWTTFRLCLFCPTTGKFRMSKGLCYEKCLQCTMRICSLWIMIC